MAKHVRYSTSLGLSRLSSEAGGAELAVVGGGPSIENHVEELRRWKGDIWAINGAWQWCQEHGIEAAYYSVCPNPHKLEGLEHCKRAVLHVHCPPDLFDALKHADVRVFELNGGVTSATAAPLTAAHAGFHKVTLFGCESSYNDVGHPNAYQVPLRKNWLRVSVPCGNGSRTFLTDPELVMQADVLSTLIRQFPFYCQEKSGGLLGAMVENQNWDGIEFSQELQSILKPIPEPVCP